MPRDQSGGKTKRASDGLRGHRFQVGKGLLKESTADAAPKHETEDGLSPTVYECKRTLWPLIHVANPSHQPVADSCD